MRETERACRTDACVACGLCTACCPVAEVMRDFPGPRLAGAAQERFRLAGTAPDPTLGLCSNCRNCDSTCPHGVLPSQLILRARTGRERPSLAAWIAAHGELLGKMARPFPAALVNRCLRSGPARALLARLGIARAAPLPAFVSRSFRSRFADLRQPGGLTRKAALFPGCFGDLYDPECLVDLVALLNRAGYLVELPAGTVCCGLPLLVNGFSREARAHALANARALGACAERGLPVLTACPSCALMFGSEYRELCADRAGPELPGLTDAGAFLAGSLQAGELGLPEKAVASLHRLVYHAPCHLRALGLGYPGFDLLRALPGVEITMAAARCCGMAGSYGFKGPGYAVAMRVGEPLFAALQDSGATLGVSECGTCRLQMRHGSGLPAVHPVRVLREALGV